MALTLTHFRPVGFDNASDRLFVDDAGCVAATEQVGARIVDCDGAWLSPGWCDLHVHVWHGGTDISVRPQQAGRATGVTAMADAGSAGEAAFHGLREYVIEPGQETIKAFLNIGSIGLVACNRVSELGSPECSIDVERTLTVAEANRDVICGIKVRASGVITRGWGITPVKTAKRVAEILGLPLMVHVGEPDPVIDEVFDVLSPGDIVTHCFNGKRAGSIGDTPALFEKAKRLAEEGICMDLGHGQASFSFDMARRALEGGLRPFSISTDLHLGNVAGPVYDLGTTMSKLLAVGLPFDEVLAAVTERPRSVLKLPTRDGMAPGRRADFTVFDLAEHEGTATDSHGSTLRIPQMFEPRMTVIGASVLSAARRSS